MSDFSDAWNSRHPGCLPVGYMLRDTGAPNWVRFHSLPGSKRYAETTAERRTILSRHHVLATDLFGHAPCWIAQSLWGQKPDEEVAFRTSRDMDLQFAFSFAVEAGTEFKHDWNVHAGLTRWTLGAFDSLLTDIADGGAAPTIWMSAETGAVFAPYDGGVDLFLNDAASVTRLKMKHRAWLSEHPEGL